MFQYAAGLALAEKHQTVLKLDTSWFRRHSDHEGHCRYALSCFNIVEQFATGQECRQLGSRRAGSPLKRLASLVSRPSRFFTSSSAARIRKPVDVGFVGSFDQQPDNTYLSGYFQSERIFGPVADLIRLQFSHRYPPGEATARISAGIARASSVSVHIRRGDYVSRSGPRNEIGPLSLDYYYAGLKLVQEQAGDVKVYVFSDDIAAVRQDFRPSADCVFVDVAAEFNAHDDLRLMSLCNHHIISNSTFSWWGAWLNPSPEKIVVAPDPWFAGTRYSGQDIIPARWLKMPRAPETR